MCDMTLAGKSLSNQLPFESQHEGTWKWKIHERRLYVGILYTDVFFCLVLKVKASMTGYDHLLQCLFASWFGLAIAYLRGEARPQLAKFAFFLLLFVKLQHDLLYTLICFFWSPGTTAPKSGKKSDDGIQVVPGEILVLLQWVRVSSRRLTSKLFYQRATIREPVSTIKVLFNPGLLRQNAYQRARAYWLPELFLNLKTKKTIQAINTPLLFGVFKFKNSPGDFTWNRRKFELLETLRGVGDSPGILSKTWIQVLHL